MSDSNQDLKNLIMQWTDRINELDSKIKANGNPDYVALQSEYIRLQKCTIQAQNLLLNNVRSDKDMSVGDSVDNAVILPESVIS